MKGVKYVAPTSDFSGYAQASRDYILALHKAGVSLTVQPHCFDRNPPPVGSNHERATIQSLINRDIEYDIVIVHLTPDLAPAYARQHPDKYVINYTAWETSKLHPLWADACNQVSEVWIPSEWNLKAFKESGVTVPITKIHHGINVDMYLNQNEKFPIQNTEGTFNFYSIFQWNARKNPLGMLRAYFNAFQDSEDVRLILKTYIGGGLPPHEELQRIKAEIAAVKSDMRLRQFPKVTLITEQLSTEHVRALHLFGDAYISIPHGEGFGLTLFEAGLAGKPVIGTNGGGQLEFLDQENSYLVDASWTYVYGMGTFNAWYLGDQKWLYPDLIDAADKMRHVFLNREEAKQRGLKLQEHIKSNFSWEKVAEQMIARLSEI